MEQIIASISRIIAEDHRSTDAVRAAADKGGILELTEAVGADGSVRRLAPLGGSSAGAAAGGEPGLASPAPRSDREPPRPDPPHQDRAHQDPPRPDPAAAAKPEHAPERILSPATSGAAASAFARLGAIPRERRAEADQIIGAGERTLEEIVRDTLRPLLQAWLDAHLPGIVERLVREEIGRVVGEAGLR